MPVYVEYPKNVQVNYQNKSMNLVRLLIQKQYSITNSIVYASNKLKITFFGNLKKDI